MQEPGELTTDKRFIRLLPYFLIAFGALMDLVTTEIALSTGKLFEQNPNACPLLGIPFLWLLIVLNRWLTRSYPNDKTIKNVSFYCIVLTVGFSWFAAVWNAIHILIVTI